MLTFAKLPLSAAADDSCATGWNRALSLRADQGIDDEHR